MTNEGRRDERALCGIKSRKVFMGTPRASLHRPGMWERDAAQPENEIIGGKRLGTGPSVLPYLHFIFKLPNTRMFVPDLDCKGALGKLQWDFTASPGRASG